MAGIVHKDVRLMRYQCGGRARLGTATYPFEVPVNNIARVKVAEALGDIGKLATEVSVG